MAMTGTVTSKGQVTIPKRLRDQLGIRAGEVLEFAESGPGELVARKLPLRDAVDEAYGLIQLKVSTDVRVDAMRGKADIA